MAYDEELADRIRELVGGETGLTEQKMFGGLAFLIGGNMAVAASGQGGMLVHVDPAESDALVATTEATPDGDARPLDARVAPRRRRRICARSASSRPGSSAAPRTRARCRPRPGAGLSS